MLLPHFNNEKIQWEKGDLVLGIDEVGRGCFAGPLVVGGVVFDNLCNTDYIDLIASLEINDSKKLTPTKRAKLSVDIMENSLFTTTVFVPVDIINEIGIGNATQLGMRQVVEKTLNEIGHKSLYVLTDAFEIIEMREIQGRQKAIIRGDSISISIAAASIIAKVERDTYMKQIAKDFPEYGFDEHVGYGTKKHREAIKKYGLSKIHRPVFCKKTLAV